jgi:hypothetical protein
MALSLFSIQNAKAREKPYKLTDGDGLHLLVNPNEASCGGCAIASAASRACSPWARFRKSP